MLSRDGDGKGFEFMSNDHLGGAIPEGDGNTWMPDVWGYLAIKFNPGIVLDVGCGYGHSTKWWSDLGCHVVGVDGFQACIDQNVCKKGRIIKHDFATGPYLHGTPFDLVWSCEFLEHVEERFLPNLKATFQQGRYAVVTHAEPHQSGQHHVNCQSSSYWIHMFESWGFKHLGDETELLRKSDRHRAAWGRRTLLVFERV